MKRKILLLILQLKFILFFTKREPAVLSVVTAIPTILRKIGLGGKADYAVKAPLSSKIFM
jgi:hypothetical protein